MSFFNKKDDRFLFYTLNILQTLLEFCDIQCLHFHVNDIDFFLPRSRFSLVKDDKKEALQVCEMKEEGDDFR